MEEFDVAAFIKSYGKGEDDPRSLELMQEAERCRKERCGKDYPPPATPDVACEPLSFLNRVDEYFVFARYISYFPDCPGDAVVFTRTGTQSSRTTVRWDKNAPVRYLEEEIPADVFMNLISECQSLDFLRQPECLEGGVTYHMADDWFGLRLIGSEAKWMRVPGCASKERIEVDLKDLVDKYAPAFFRRLIDDKAGLDESEVVDSDP